jgi:hypothetical protein
MQQKAERTAPTSPRVPPHPEPRRSTRPSREPGAHHPRAMPHVCHRDGTSGPGVRAREVIAKLAKDAYFMRVDNKVTQVPVRNCQQDNEATSRSAGTGRNHTRAELPANPNRTRATAGGPSQGGNSAGDDREIIPHRGPGGGGSNGGSSNHGAGRRAGGGGDRGGRGHANSHASGDSCGGFNAR